jgi:hypothetical protein
MPFEVSNEHFERLTEAISRAAERNQAIIETGLKNWEVEVERYYQEFSAHSRDTLDALGRCKGPMDVLGVEQQWLNARAKAYFDSGMRFAKVFSDIAQTAPAGPATARTVAEDAQPKA